MESFPAYLSPLGLTLALAWNVVVLASIQLTVRLIRAFSIRTTVFAGVLLTGATVPITYLFQVVFRSRPEWLPGAMLLTAGVGFLIADRVLRFRRRRSTIVAAVGIGLLSGPWGAFIAAAP